VGNAPGVREIKIYEYFRCNLFLSDYAFYGRVNWPVFVGIGGLDFLSKRKKRHPYWEALFCYASMSSSFPLVEYSATYTQLPNFVTVLPVTTTTSPISVMKSFSTLFSPLVKRSSLPFGRVIEIVIQFCHAPYSTIKMLSVSLMMLYEAQRLALNF